MRVRPLEEATVPGRAVSAAPDGAEQQKFILSRITLHGMTAYAPEDIEGLYAKHLGQQISVKTLYDILADIHNRYLQDGYTLTRVFLPPQHIENGAVHINIVEGYVSKVDLGEGMQGDPVIADAAARILAMRPLNTLKLERLLLVINSLPEMQASAILGTLSPTDPGAGEAGAVRLILQNAPARQTRAEVSADNHGSVFAGPVQVYATSYFYSVFRRHDSLRATASGSIPLEEMHFGALQYSRPLFGASGMQLHLGGSAARNVPGGNLRMLDIRGTATSVSAGMSYPLVLQRGRTLRADTSFEVKDAQTDSITGTLYDDRLCIVQGGINYNASDRYYGVSLIDLRYAQGMDVLGVRGAGAPLLSRADGETAFRKANILLGRLQSLPRNVEIYTLLQGQYAWDPLLSSEEFGFGGGSIGRGYNPSEITGDRGISATVELRKNIAKTVWSLDTVVQPYAFYDVGKIWNIDNVDTTGQSAAAAGAGARIYIENQIDVDFNVAVPLTKEPDDAPKYITGKGPRFLLSITKRF